MEHRSRNEFRAYRITEEPDGSLQRAIVRRTLDDLPQGNLVVRVLWSSLNYKDALSAVGNRGVTRKYPHTPGIDAAGVVYACGDGCCPDLNPGDPVIVTGFDLGMNTDGGFGEFIRVPSEWAVPLPEGLTLKESMMIGTAGLTAGLSLREILRSGIEPGDGPVLVTGATGGVGSVATAILSKLGYSVTDVTGKTEEGEYLRRLGAEEVLSRTDFLEGSERPLLKPTWSAAVDCVGGSMLAAAIKGARYDGVVTCSGLVGSSELSVTIYPFILRGVRLLGIYSADSPLERRMEVWKHLASDWKPARLSEMVTEIGLEDLDSYIETILGGGLRRRVLLRVAAE